MTDFNEKHGDIVDARAANDVDSDFEGHRLGAPERVGDVTDARAATDEDADFEGHRMFGTERVAKVAKIGGADAKA
jgi:hypothetical protein